VIRLAADGGRDVRAPDYFWCPWVLSSAVTVPLLPWGARRAADQPSNFVHLQYLVQAERAWALGDLWHAAAEFDAAVREAGGVKLLARAVEGVETKDLKSLVDDGKKQIGSGVVAIVGVTEDGKAGIVVGVTADLTSRFNAVELVRKGSEALGGKGGGGRPDMAQAGGPDGAKATEALSAIEKAMAGA